jgi:hypothetical protein
MQSSYISSMPMFVYEVVSGPLSGERFERLERHDAEPMTFDVDRQASVRRVYEPPTTARRLKVSSEEKAAKAGFSTFKRAGDGVWEKRAGSGPARLHK